jgi:LPXTG-motif cell wall-anchored protein
LGGVRDKSGVVMNKTIAIVSTTGALLFGGAGIANAAVEGAPAPSSTVTTLADNTNGNTNQNSDNSGMWGLLGLLGLLGLGGLKRRNAHEAGVGTASTATPKRV